jgi:ABC-type sugar transport system substrate-binding protein
MNTKRIAATAAATLLMLGAASTASAAPKLSGTITAPQNVTVGDTITYDATVTGRVQRGWVVHIMTVCSTTEEPVNRMVYQAASRIGDSVTLIGNDFFTWTNESATCTARLTARDQYKGTILTLNEVSYPVASR